MIDVMAMVMEIDSRIEALWHTIDVMAMVMDNVKGFKL